VTPQDHGETYPTPVNALAEKVAMALRGAWGLGLKYQSRPSDDTIAEFNALMGKTMDAFREGPEVTLDIERLAREAGIPCDGAAFGGRPVECLRAFAASVLEEAARRLMDMDFETTRHNYYHVAANAVRDLKPK
jgi:uncharacterized protein (DUF2236 family)